MKEKQYKKNLKNYEFIEITWNKGKYGKYKLLKELNKKAFINSTKSTHKAD
tara:strand:+ start:1458 stop:1610 length:153 start_codon:yes stop_codon:yes gene_type:complete